MVHSCFSGVLYSSYVVKKNVSTQIFIGEVLEQLVICHQVNVKMKNKIQILHTKILQTLLNQRKITRPELLKTNP